MKPILIKKYGKKQIFFYSDCIKIVKEQEVIFEINVNDIETITYNIKFSIGDFLTLLFCSKYGTSVGYGSNCFVIRNNVKPKLITLNIKKHEYEILRDKFKRLIEII